jgi:CNT family concentrative nucleoside transporter
MIWHGLGGIVLITLLAWLLGERRGRPDWRLLVGGLSLQVLLALVLLKVPQSQLVFAGLNHMVLGLDAALGAGTAFVFGYLGGSPPPFEAGASGSSFILAFRALPLILFMSALSALLYHWRILPLLVRGLTWLLQRFLGIGGALGLSTAANVFVGMVEAPLLIRPYLLKMDAAELFAMMTCGMATIAGTVMVLYAGFIGPVIPNAMGHILTASLISAPAALMIAGLMHPFRDKGDRAIPPLESHSHSSMDAITRGTQDGLSLYLNIVAMLVVFVALVHLANSLAGLLPAVQGEPLSLQRVLGWLMAPVVWMLGIPWDEALTAGRLMGIKTVLNELLAYLELANLPEDALSQRSRLIMTYALCGFANLGSLGIMIGGLTAMLPERRTEIIQLGIKSLLAGTMATCMTGAIVGLMVQ